MDYLDIELHLLNGIDKKNKRKYSFRNRFNQESKPSEFTAKSSKNGPKTNNPLYERRIIESTSISTYKNTAQPKRMNVKENNKFVKKYKTNKNNQAIKQPKQFPVMIVN